MNGPIGADICIKSGVSCFQDWVQATNRFRSTCYNLFQSAFTDWCLMTSSLRKLGVRS